MTNQEALNTIKDLFKDTKVSTPINGELTLCENGRQATLNNILLKNVRDSFIIKYDECDFMSRSAFKPEHPSLFKGCDAIVFCLNNNSPSILFCELKSSRPRKAEVSPQFKGGQCFLECLVSILRIHRDCDIPTSEWKKYFFVFHAGSSVQKETIQNGPQIESTATRPIYIPTCNNQSFYLQQLLKK